MKGEIYINNIKIVPKLKNIIQYAIARISCLYKHMMENFDKKW